MPTYDVTEPVKNFRTNYNGNQLRRIQAINGGSLLNFMTKAGVTDTPTLIVSLGGLGAKTINQIKKNYLDKINDPVGRVQFLALDTCDKELNSINRDHAADGKVVKYMKDDECVNIFHDDSTNVAGICETLHMPGCVSPMLKWFDMGIARDTVLDRTGAQGIRQLGRLMLSIQTNYDYTYGKIIEKFNILNQTATGGAANVIIVAGVSGGTGSGTIVDISYMIRLAAKEVFGAITTNIDAILYSPDVQAQTDADYSLLERNFVAAMKEIDTFFKADLTHDKYTFPCQKFPNGILVSNSGGFMVNNPTPEAIFSSCTIVQGVNGHGGYLPMNDVINVVADYVTNFVSNIQALDKAGISVQMLSATLSNERGNKANAVSVAKNANPNLPRDSYYEYRVMGFKSIDFPAEALITILANKTTEKLMELFGQEPPGNLAQQCLKEQGLFDVESLIGKGARNDSIMRQIDDSVDVGVDDIRRYTVNDIIGQINIPQSLYDTSWVDDVMAALMEHLKSEMRDRGPYSALKLCQQIRKHLEGIIGDWNTNAKNGLGHKKDDAYNNVLAAHQECRNAGFFHKDDRETAKENVNSYLRDYLKYEWILFNDNYKNIIRALDDLYSKILAKNNNVFDNYVGAFYAIADILHNDSSAAVSTALTIAPTAQTFQASLINLADVRNTNSRLHQLIEYYIDENRVSQLANDLMTNMLDNEDAWTNLAHFDGVQKMRESFEKYFAEFKASQLEKILIMKYTDGIIDIDNLLKAFDIIDHPDPGVADPWAEFEQQCINTYNMPQSPLEIAADQIALLFNSVGTCAVKDPSSLLDLNALYKFEKYVLMDQMPHLNQKLRTKLIAGGASANDIINSPDSPEMFRMIVTCGVPLYMLAGMRQHQGVYENCLQTANIDPHNAGMHMDANEEQGWKNFQPIISNDALRYLDPNNELAINARQRNDYIREKSILNNVENTTDACISYDFIRPIYNTNINPVTNKPDLDHYELLEMTNYNTANDNQNDVLRNAVVTNYKAEMDRLAQELENGNFSSEQQWLDAMKQRLDETSLSVRMENAGYVFAHYDIKLSDVLSLLSTTDKNPADTNGASDNGGLYKTVRRSATFRKNAERNADEGKKLSEMLKKTFDEYGKELAVTAMSEINNRKEKRLIAVFVKAYLTGHITIDYDYKERSVRSTLYYDINNKNKNVELINKKLSSGSFLERQYFRFGVFSKFVQLSMVRNADEQWENFLNKVNDEFNNIFSSILQQKAAELMMDNNRDIIKFDNTGYDLKEELLSINKDHASSEFIYFKETDTICLEDKELAESYPELSKTFGMKVYAFYTELNNQINGRRGLFA